MRVVEKGPLKAINPSPYYLKVNRSILSSYAALSPPPLRSSSPCAHLRPANPMWNVNDFLGHEARAFRVAWTSFCCLTPTDRQAAVSHVGPRRVCGVTLKRVSPNELWLVFIKTKKKNNVTGVCCSCWVVMFLIPTGVLYFSFNVSLNHVFWKKNHVNFKAVVSLNPQCVHDTQHYRHLCRFPQLMDITGLFFDFHFSSVVTRWIFSNLLSWSGLSLFICSYFTLVFLLLLLLFSLRAASVEHHRVSAQRSASHRFLLHLLFSFTSSLSNLTPRWPVGPRLPHWSRPSSPRHPPFNYLCLSKGS